MKSNTKATLSKNGKRMGRPPNSEKTNTTAKVAAKVVAPSTASKNVTFTSTTAARFNDARIDLNESGRIPFEVTNTQFMGLLLDTYEKSGSNGF